MTGNNKWTLRTILPSFTTRRRFNSSLGKCLSRVLNISYFPVNKYRWLRSFSESGVTLENRRKNVGRCVIFVTSLHAKCRLFSRRVIVNRSKFPVDFVRVFLGLSVTRREHRFRQWYRLVRCQTIFHAERMLIRKSRRRVPICSK